MTLAVIKVNRLRKFTFTGGIITGAIDAEELLSRLLIEEIENEVKKAQKGKKPNTTRLVFLIKKYYNQRKAELDGQQGIYEQ